MWFNECQYAVSHLFQPISEWTPGQVLDWMKAMQLYGSLDCFKSERISGADLIDIDEDSLQVSWPLCSSTAAYNTSSVATSSVAAAVGLLIDVSVVIRCNECIGVQSCCAVQAALVAGLLGLLVCTSMLALETGLCVS